MTNSFNQNQTSQREVYEQKYNNSRNNLLWVVIFTAINLTLLVTNSGTYFLFSAYIPYFITIIGMLLCGRYPAEYYIEYLGEELVFFDNTLFIILLVISIVITLLYLLSWFMSRKNRVGWLIFALVFFTIDTVGMLLIAGISVESIVDILFHAWVIFSLISGIVNHFKLKKLPPEQKVSVYENDSEQIEENGENSQPVIQQTPDSNIIRRADNDVKHRVLLETRVSTYNICYRRVKHTNELVINGNVYDELEGIIESAHILKAWVDGHYISAGYNGIHSIISFDGETVAKKLRLV